jgi:hypothetical protein
VHVQVTLGRLPEGCIVQWTVVFLLSVCFLFSWTRHNAHSFYVMCRLSAAASECWSPASPLSFNVLAVSPCVN